MNLSLKILLLSMLLLSGCFGGARRLSIADRAEFNLMMADLRQARAVFVGEFHDQRDHHRLQLEVIRGLHQSGKLLAIGLEMFDLEKQPILDEWVKGQMPLKEFVARYLEGWNINWAEYDAIMLFARNNRIPMIALDAPPDLVKTVTYGGAKALGRKEAQRLPHGVTTEITASYRDFMAEAFRAHTIPGGMFDNFCAAQGLRNNTMAKLIAGYLEKNPERTVVVIAGVGHAMRRAVPSALALPLPAIRIVIPEVSGLYDELARTDMDYFLTFGD